jgi:uncharacterized protein (DUF2235 family)
MGKRIIILSDGTGNSAAQVWRTNVWRVFEALDLSGSGQVAFYDDGVGTSSFKPLAILGGAFGWGLKRNVVDLYKFLSRNYKTAADYDVEGATDDEIFAFGFSRGAFTIRVVVGLVLDQGLVSFTSESDLEAKAADAYRKYRARHYKTKTGIERLFRKIRDLFLRFSTKHTRPRPVQSIRFLGLWDTVAAYGLPVDEMTRGVSRYLWPLELPNRRLDLARVKRACHALALDDERTTFHPVLWDESPARDPAGGAPQPINPVNYPRLTRDEKLTQVWFAGVHSNVGGGYPDDSLSGISLNWMIEEALDCGLQFKPEALALLRTRQDKDGRLYDSRTGFSGYYRYGPRSVEDLSTRFSDDPRDCVTIARPKIHDSVFARIGVGAHSYAPISLPKTYDVVRKNTDGRYQVEKPSYSTCEDAQSAVDRYDRQERLSWVGVWRGRALYFLTVIASVHLLVYPLQSTLTQADERTTQLRFVSDLIRLLGDLLPGLAARWINGYARDPVWFLISAAMVGVLIYLSAGLKARISDDMRRLWNASYAKSSTIDSVSQRAANWRPAGFAEWAVVIIFAALVIVAAAFDEKDLKGALSTNLANLLAKLTGNVIVFLAAATLAVLWIPGERIHQLRSADRYKKFVLAAKMQIVPLASAVLFLGLGLLFGAHYVFNIADGFGAYCKPSRVGDKPINASNGNLIAVCKSDDVNSCAQDLSAENDGRTTCDKHDKAAGCTARVAIVDTRNLCTPTKIFLEKNKRYQLDATQLDDPAWTFAGVPSSLGGLPLAAFDPPDNTPWTTSQGIKTNLYAYGRKALMFVLYPLRRSFDRSWGSLILRYGDTGNDENFIDSDPNMTVGELRRTVSLSEPFTPRKDGELFVYLNRPIGVSSLFPDFNAGKIRVLITRIPPRK